MHQLSSTSIGNLYTPLFPCSPLFPATIAVTANASSKEQSSTKGQAYLFPFLKLQSNRSRRYRTPRYLRLTMPFLRQDNLQYLFRIPYYLSREYRRHITLSSQGFGEKSIPAMFESMLTMQFKKMTLVSQLYISLKIGVAP